MAVGDEGVSVDGSIVVLLGRVRVCDGNCGCVCSACGTCFL